MNLASLTARLAELDPNANIRIDDGTTPERLLSYRGYYDHLAIDYRETDPRKPVKVRSLLDEARKANGATFTGYKGGEYVMNDYTPVWVSRYGDAESRAITSITDDGKVAVIETAEIGDYA